MDCPHSSRFRREHCRTGNARVERLIVSVSSGWQELVRVQGKSMREPMVPHDLAHIIGKLSEEEVKARIPKSKGLSIHSCEPFFLFKDFE